MSILHIRQPLTNCVGTAVKRNIGDSCKFSLGQNVLSSVTQKFPYIHRGFVIASLRQCLEIIQETFGSEIFVI